MTVESETADGDKPAKHVPTTATDKDITTCRCRIKDTLPDTPGGPGPWLYHMFRALIDAADPRPVRVHDLRHGCVSLLLALGVPPRTVMQIAGHTVMEMTMERCGHVNYERPT